MFNVYVLLKFSGIIEYISYKYTNIHLYYKNVHREISTYLLTWYFVGHPVGVESLKKRNQSRNQIIW